ncbi:MASE1 domain-containing protein [Streptomyces albidochromogenes]|uniref:MASE1 domain-containing protein n=1 Tax=Streptomyces albidochromogenes TaxID=329524 RepID=A0ABW6FL96_9ACTN
MMRTEEIRRVSGVVLRILGVAAAYFAAGQIGLLEQVTVEGSVVTPLWPPTGIALSCLLHMGLRIWPGIALGTLLVVLSLTSFRPAEIAIMAGNTLAPVCAYLMLRRVGYHAELNRLRDGVALVFLGALGGMLISATVGCGTLALTRNLPLGDFWPVWAAWWAGDAMGVLVVTPLLVVLRRIRLPRDTSRWAEAAALAVTAAVVVPLATRSEMSLLFLAFPLLIWAALRFRLAGSAPCAMFVSVLAISAAIDRVGPFADHSLFEVMLTLQALNGSAALTGLLLAAIITEQQNVRTKIELACHELAEVVERLAPGEAAHRLGPGLGERGRAAD